MLWDIGSAAQEIQNGNLSPIELLDYCLANIDRYEPHVSAWVLVDRERARADAEKSAAELNAGRRRGPLHGIPLGIKDIIDVADWPTAAGSWLWEQSVARRDATVVRRLRQAGAVILGKTVTTQYASFDPPPTHNPWNLEHTPGGSSSGSAAAVACGMCLGALGSQTGGSLTRPAAYCGIASCKPTFSRVSTDGVVPLAPSMDHIGPLAGRVRDLALLLQAIAGSDSRDPACSKRMVPDYVVRLNGSAKPPTFGRLRGPFEELAEPSALSLMEEVIQKFLSRRAIVTEVGLPAEFAEVLPRHRIVMAVEAAAFHAARLHRYPDDYAPNIRTLLEEGLACPAPDYAESKEHQRELFAAMLPCFEEVDALLTPATTGPAPDSSTTGDPAFNSPWSYTGLPTVSLRAGEAPGGLPLAIQVIGLPWSEAELLATAAWCEAVLGLERIEPPEWE